MHKNSKIGIMGAGVEGIALINFLFKKGFLDLTLFDERESLMGIPDGVKTVLGKDAFEKIYDMEVLFRSPGIHKRRLETARLRGIEVTSTTQYFFESCPGKVIGVTGTKGKGTTSTLIYEILKADGRDVYLGGNIGQSPLDFMDDLTSESWVVMELSSFQLHDLTISPHVAVVLRVSSEHLDYHEDTEEYRLAKSSICRYQGAGDLCVLNADYDYAPMFADVTLAKKMWVSRHNEVSVGAFVKDGAILYKGLDEADGFKKILSVDKIDLLGDHNQENVMPASVVAKFLGVDDSTIHKAVYAFSGLKNRLEFVKEVDGVKYYNDSFSTTPETSISASYSFKKPVIMICGGSEKFSDFTEWGRELEKNRDLKAVLLMGVTADKMEEALEKAKNELMKNPTDGVYLRDFPLKVYRIANLKEGVLMARDMAQKGDVVVMSPAAASFDQFANYKERGQKFRDFVGEL